MNARVPCGPGDAAASTRRSNLAPSCHSLSRGTSACLRQGIPRDIVILRAHVSLVWLKCLCWACN